jgi:4-amino-4-deoxy-L-arabinose transferase-like glycosyltransferase
LHAVKKFVDLVAGTPEKRIGLLLAGFCLLLYIPFAGNYGMWDPWETHYGEIARQMAQRNDWLSLWWPGSPQDRVEVFHKPVMHFWLMALSMKLFGLEWGHPAPDQMVASWRAEWAARLPGIFLSIAAILAVWHVTTRLAGRRAGILAAIVLATSSQWAFVTRQAMTDMPFVVPMTIALLTFAGGLWWCAQATNKRQLYLFIAYVLCAVASLAKGPAGIGLPALVLGLYLIVSGRWRDIIWKLDLPRGAVLFIAAAFPWYHSMLIRHGWPFWNEFIGDNYVRRAQGRHGDRGTFDYYLQYIGYGMFPWSGLVMLGGLFGFTQTKGTSPRAQLVGFSLVWFLVELSTVSIVNTKFHHYILPALPALAILTGVFIDDLLRAPKRAQLIGLTLIALPLTFLCGRDLAAFPPRMLWMFNYDYVNMPGTGRPWPPLVQYGTRYEYGPLIMAFTFAATMAVAALIVYLWKTRAEEEPAAAAPIDSASPSRFFRDNAIVVGLALVGGFITASLFLTAPHGTAPKIPRWVWAVPTLFMLTWLVAVAGKWLRPRGRALALGLITAVALVWSGFILDKFLVELSPHWAQKHVVATYYHERRGPDEPLIAWMLYWRGENFYTRNEIYDPTKPQAEKTVFVGDRNIEKMQQYFKDHPGRRIFFVVERVRYETLRGLLPEKSKSTLKIVDDSNNKLYLASAQL